MPRSPTRFGAFIAPYHDPAGNPTLQLRRDLELAALLDELAYDEVWFGEHHSGAYETIASPELMIAAAAERTRRIKLGTGVNSLSYHHPYILADRIMQRLLGDGRSSVVSQKSTACCATYSSSGRGVSIGAPSRRIQPSDLPSIWMCPSG